jgi:hypothetical protein
MEPIQVAARYAAFVWYAEARNAPRRTTRREAARFACANWATFLPAVEQGWGRLLLRIASRSPATPGGAGKARTSRKPAVLG